MQSNEVALAHLRIVNGLAEGLTVELAGRVSKGRIFSQHFCQLVLGKGQRLHTGKLIQDAERNDRAHGARFHPIETCFLLRQPATETLLHFVHVAVVGGQVFADRNGGFTHLCDGVGVGTAKH